MYLSTLKQIWTAWYIISGIEIMFILKYTIKASNEKVPLRFEK